MHGVLNDLNRAALEQGVDLVVIKELLSHAHIGVTADVYAHVRLRLQRQAIGAMRTPSATRATILTTYPPQPSSADVAVKHRRALIDIAVDEGSCAVFRVLKPQPRGCRFLKNPSSSRLPRILLTEASTHPMKLVESQPSSSRTLHCDLPHIDRPMNRTLRRTFRRFPSTRSDGSCPRQSGIGGCQPPLCIGEPRLHHGWCRPRTDQNSSNLRSSPPR
ncbi:hypothetical protein H074_37623 [Amycolatopsis decaplanina DSM 44594]|uniref:Tyr recombinase domain-containing protein n=1 Tax=Amycolatopsis decaplanina DSM 44594 TaxID=1284240 RepID=M2YQ39_9PSEU|nr:hypothetical protein H074_37623 [Amycolatopsis decaplanina DSM 44594]